MYRVAKAHTAIDGQTDRQTVDFMIPIAAVRSSKELWAFKTVSAIPFGITAVLHTV